jgi:hypothetical protein
VTGQPTAARAAESSQIIARRARLTAAGARAAAASITTGKDQS